MSGENATHPEWALGKIAVLIPCYNEELSIGKVVRDFRMHLPEADVYVYNNNSSDRTSEVAQEAGATVRDEYFQGKGNVVRRMFADIEADTYVLVDGDETYDVASVPALLKRYLTKRVDTVIGARIATAEAAYRMGHRLGNRLFSLLAGYIFGHQVKDIFSGYRVFSRRFVKSFPALSSGFEIETELTIHALELRMAIAEIDTCYYPRPTGSTSKLRTYRDGWRILVTIVNLVKEERPLQFFFSMFVGLALAGLLLGTPIVITFMGTGEVVRYGTAVLSTGFILLAFLSLVCGLILDTVTRGRREMKRMQYLVIPGPAQLDPIKTAKPIQREITLGEDDDYRRLCCDLRVHARSLERSSASGGLGTQPDVSGA